MEREWMLALHYYETRMLCPICGGLASECQGGQAERAFKAGSPIRCYRRNAQAAFTSTKEFGKYTHPDALLIPVTYDPSRVIPTR